MGACASVAKAMKAEAGVAPPPEPAKEETTTAAEAAKVAEVKREGEVKGEEGGEKKVEEGDDKEKVVDEAGDKQQSLGSLLNEDTQEVKESSTTEKETIPLEKEKEEETKEESLPISDVVAEAPVEPKVEQVQLEATKETLVEKEQK